MNLGAPLRFPRNDLGIPPRSFTYSGQPNPLLGFAPHLYRGGMLAVGHDFQPGAHASVVPGGAFQAGKFTGEEPTPGGAQQPGAAAAGAGPGAGAEGETPGGGIVSSADQAFSTAKQIVGAAQALAGGPSTTAAPSTTSAPATTADLGATAPPPEPDLSKPETIASGLETMSTPASAVQNAPVSGLEQMGPATMPPEDVMHPATTVASRLSGRMDLGAAPQVGGSVSPTEAAPGQKEEIPPLGAGAAGAAAAGAGVAAGTMAPGPQPGPSQASAGAIGSTAAPATPVAPQGPSPAGIATPTETQPVQPTAPEPTGVTDTGSAATAATGQGPSGTLDTTLAGAKGALNLGTGVYDLLRGNVPTGISEVAGSAPGVAKVAGALTGTDLTKGAAGQGITGGAQAVSGAVGLAQAIQGDDPAGAIRAALSTAQGTNALLVLAKSGIPQLTNIIATYLPLLNLGLAIGTRDRGGAATAGASIGAQIGTYASQQAALEAAAAGIEGEVAGGAAGGATASGAAAGGAEGGVSGGAIGGAGAGLAAGAVTALVVAGIQYWGASRDAAKAAWEAKEAKKQLGAFQKDPTVMNTGNDLAEFETSGSPASIKALGHDISSATFTAAKASEHMNMNSLVSSYLTPLLQFASKSPKYEDVLIEAYYQMSTQGGVNPTPGSRDGALFTAWNAFRNVGAPITPRIKAMLPPYTPPQYGNRDYVSGGQPLTGQDPYLAYRDQPTSLSLPNLGAPTSPGGRPTGINLPVDANGMVTVYRQVGGGMAGYQTKAVQVPWQQVTQDDMAMLQGQGRGGSAGGM